MNEPSRFRFQEPEDNQVRRTVSAKRRRPDAAAARPAHPAPAQQPPAGQPNPVAAAPAEPPARAPRQGQPERPPVRSAVLPPARTVSRRTTAPAPTSVPGTPMPQIPAAQAAPAPQASEVPEIPQPTTAPEAPTGPAGTGEPPANPGWAEPAAPAGVPETPATPADAEEEPWILEAWDPFPEPAPAPAAPAAAAPAAAGKVSEGWRIGAMALYLLFAGILTFFIMRPLTRRLLGYWYADHLEFLYDHPQLVQSVDIALPALIALAVVVSVARS